jgi:mRNA interferase HicA
MPVSRNLPMLCEVDWAMVLDADDALNVHVANGRFLAVGAMLENLTSCRSSPAPESSSSTPTRSSSAAHDGPKRQPKLMVATLLAARLVNTYVPSVTSAEFKRWLERQGASFEPAKGGHIWVLLRGRRAILPMHGSRKEMKRGTVAAIKKQLGLE